MQTTYKMRHYIYLFITFLIFSITTASFAQTGEINGKVIDRQTKSPVPYATITLELNGAIVAGAQSDMSGKYAIKPLTPGRYNVKAVLNGYQPTVVKGIKVVSDKFSVVTLEMRKDSLKGNPIIK
jgi:hypothetical protein